MKVSALGISLCQRIPLIWAQIESLRDWSRNQRQFFLVTVSALSHYGRLRLVTDDALHFLLLAAVVAVNVEESRLSAEYAVDLERLRAGGTRLFFSTDFGTATRASDVYGRFLAAEGTDRVLWHH